MSITWPNFSARTLRARIRAVMVTFSQNQFDELVKLSGDDPRKVEATVKEAIEQYVLTRKLKARIEACSRQMTSKNATKI